MTRMMSSIARAGRGRSRLGTGLTSRFDLHCGVCQDVVFFVCLSLVDWAWEENTEAAGSIRLGCWDIVKTSGMLLSPFLQ